MKSQELKEVMLKEKEHIKDGSLEGGKMEGVIRQNYNVIRLIEAQIKQAAHNLKAGKAQILDL